MKASTHEARERWAVTARWAQVVDDGLWPMVTPLPGNVEIFGDDYEFGLFRAPMIERAREDERV